VGRLLKNPFTFLLRHTAENTEDLSLPCRFFELLKTMKNFLLRLITDAASVVEDEFGILRLRNLCVALLQKRSYNLFGVVGVHLAAEGLNVKRLHLSLAL